MINPNEEIKEVDEEEVTENYDDINQLNSTKKY